MVQKKTKGFVERTWQVQRFLEGTEWEHQNARALQEEPESTIREFSTAHARICIQPLPWTQALIELWLPLFA